PFVSGICQGPFGKPTPERIAHRGKNPVSRFVPATWCGILHVDIGTCCGTGLRPKQPTRKGGIMMKMMDAHEIISYIQNSEKKTPVKVYIKGDLEGIDFGPDAKAFVTGRVGVIFGDWKALKPVLDAHKDRIEEMVVENDRRNSA